MPFLDAGFGFATVITATLSLTLRTALSTASAVSISKPGQTAVAKRRMGSDLGLGLGLSRAMDYFETDKDIDAHRIALQGASRLGKTVLWAGSSDTRFKLVIASVSGESGAALSRRNFGETVAHMTDPTRYYYQFAPNYHSYSNR
jgi:hypothetical protein